MPTYAIKVLEWQGENGKKVPRVMATHLEEADSPDKAIIRVGRFYCGGRIGYDQNDPRCYASVEGWEIVENGKT